MAFKITTMLREKLEEGKRARHCELYDERARERERASRVQWKGRGKEGEEMARNGWNKKKRETEREKNYYLDIPDNRNEKR